MRPGPFGPRPRGAVAAPPERIAGRRVSSAAMPLLSPETLMTRIGDPDLRIADVRWWLADRAKGRRDYEAGHIPGAVFVDLDADLAAPPGPGRHPLPSPAAFAARMAELGFDDATEIVAYDDAGGTIAARLWWMLDDLGHSPRPRARRRDRAWTAIGGSLTAEVPAPARAGSRSLTMVGDDRRRRARGTARRRRPHRRPRAGAVPRGRRARRRGRRPHPDGRQPPERRQPRAGRAVPGLRPCAPGSRPLRCRRRRDSAGRGDRVPQRARDAGRRARRPAALPGLVQRLVARRADRWRPATTRCRPTVAGGPRPPRAGATRRAACASATTSAAANPIARSPNSATWKPNRLPPGRPTARACARSGRTPRTRLGSAGTTRRGPVGPPTRWRRAGRRSRRARSSTG